MANLTLAGWKRSVAAGVIESVPLQTFDSAFLLAEDFLATQGGWNPDDAGDPTGPGVPVSGISLEDAITLILEQQLNRIHHIEIEGTIAFRAILNQNLSTGLSDPDIIASVTIPLNSFVSSQFQATNLELVNIDDFDGTITNGPTTAQERRSIQTLIESGGKNIDPKAIALIVARARFNLDNTHNVQYLYTEENKDIFVLISKYQSTQYDSLATDGNKFGIKLDPLSFKTTSGVILSNS